MGQCWPGICAEFGCIRSETSSELNVCGMHGEGKVLGRVQFPGGRTGGAGWNTREGRTARMFWGKPLGEGHCIKPLRKSPPPPSIVQQSLDFLPLQPFILRGSPNLAQPVPVGHLGSNPTTNYSLSYWSSSIYESHEVEQEPPRSFLSSVSKELKELPGIKEGQLQAPAQGEAAEGAEPTCCELGKAVASLPMAVLSAGDFASFTWSEGVLKGIQDIATEELGAHSTVTCSSCPGEHVSTEAGPLGVPVLPAQG